MLCKNPYSDGGGHLFPCGQCLPCRINKRRMWTHRIMLESLLHSHSSFVTLTYSDDVVPVVGDNKYPTLRPKDLQDWLKRFRKAIEPGKVRYYGVGEYGDRTHRPHYHLALFGFQTCLHGRSRYRYRKSCCVQCDTVRETWGLGQVDLGDLTVDSAQYIAGYVTKKMTAKDDSRLNGRAPEFARMSLRPGIGADFMHEVASSVLEFNLDQSQGDVPSSLRHGSRNMPLGRYLRRRLRKLVGRDESAPQSTLDEVAEELRPLREAAFNASASFKESVVEASAGKVAQIEAKYRLFKKGESL